MAGDNQSCEPPFDRVLTSPVSLPTPEAFRFRSLSDMLLREEGETVDRQAVLVGDVDGSEQVVTVADLRHAAIRIRQWCQAAGLHRGDSLTLVRLPRSSDVPLAVAMLGLATAGIRVVLPMSATEETLPRILTATQSRAVLWCGGQKEPFEHADARRTEALLRRIADGLKLAAMCIDRDLPWKGPVQPPASLATEAESDGASDEVLVLTTTGSTGQPKLVRYAEQTLLTVAEAWLAAGLMDEERTGGASICPMLSHSMGLRNMLHAVWNRRPTLLIQPEWLDDDPLRFLRLMEAWPPQHITCGPALLGALGRYAQRLPEVRGALRSLRCVVSSGAAVDAQLAALLPKEVRLANAFGMTETQQVLNSLLEPRSQATDVLGPPLPGVSVAVRFTDAARHVGRLYVNTPFGARGYVGEPDFGSWFETGDLVEWKDDRIRWIGRADDDYLNTGLGVKLATTGLEGIYAELAECVEGLVFLECAARQGVIALAFVGSRDPEDRALHKTLRAALRGCHRRLAASAQAFELRYGTLAALGCVVGRVPRRGPGKIDRRRILTEHAELLAALREPATPHPCIVEAPKIRRLAGDRLTSSKA